MYHYMTSYGYIIMIIVDSCIMMVWFHFDCIIQLKKSYHIATNVCSRKSATTFGDLPDWLCKQTTVLLTFFPHVAIVQRRTNYDVIDIVVIDVTDL